MLQLDVNRREFLKIAAGTGVALAIPPQGHAAVSSKSVSKSEQFRLWMKEQRKFSIFFRNADA